MHVCVCVCVFEQCKGLHKTRSTGFGWNGLELFTNRIQVKPAILLIPIDLFLFLLVEEFYGTRYQSGSFPLINVGSVFSLPASLFLYKPHEESRRDDDVASILKD